MKQLTCEMCGSTDIMKRDGMFVCQSCGCKYSVEEAKKMMVEGTVDVSGSTVKVDTSGELANLYQIARRARDDNNSSNAAKYYDMILVKDPTSWEASFYNVYFQAMDCKIGQIRSAAISVNNCEDSVLALIRDYVPEKDQENAVAEIVMRSIYIATILANGAKNHYNGIDSDIRNRYTQEYVDNVCAARNILYTCGSQIESIFGDREELAVYAANAWKAGIAIHTEILFYLDDKQSNIKVMASYEEKIGKYDPEHEKQFKRTYIKPQLESEIAALKKTIYSTPTETKINGFGVFLFLIAMLLIAMTILVQVEFGDTFWYGWLVGVPVALLGIGMAMPDKKAIENNRVIVKETKEKLAKKQEELNNLTK